MTIDTKTTRNTNKVTLSYTPRIGLTRKDEKRRGDGTMGSGGESVRMRMCHRSVILNLFQDLIIGDGAETSLT